MVGKLIPIERFIFDGDITKDFTGLLADVGIVPNEGNNGVRVNYSQDENHTYTDIMVEAENISSSRSVISALNSYISSGRYNPSMGVVIVNRCYSHLEK
jgi:hypothetical protein